MVAHPASAPAVTGVFASENRLPSSFEYRGFAVEFIRKAGPGADWEFRSLSWDGDPEDRSPRGHAATAGEVIEEIDEWIAENEAPATVDAAIRAHLAAVMVDETSFTEDCKPICPRQAKVTGAAEIAAFRAFVDAPCWTAGDVQAKLSYLLNGTVGVREPLIGFLAADEYAPRVDGEIALNGVDLMNAFLRSLLASVEAPA